MKMHSSSCGSGSDHFGAATTTAAAAAVAEMIRLTHGIGLVRDWHS